MGGDYARDRHLGDQFENQRFGLLVEVSGALIEDEELGLAIERPRQQHLLALAGRQRMGIALVACRATSTSVDEGAKITSTFMRTSSVASSGSWSIVSVQRNSMTMFFSST